MLIDTTSSLFNRKFTTILCVLRLKSDKQSLKPYLIGAD